jgi:capsular exopolysaccharide synthesis family protein
MDFRTFIQTLVRHWKIVAAALLACLLGAAAVTVFQNKSYQSSATILISISGETNVMDVFYGTEASQKRLSSYAAIAGGRAVAERAVTQLHLPINPDVLASQTKVAFTPDSTLLNLTVTDGDPKQAAALAGAMADQFAALVPTLGKDPARLGRPGATPGSARGEADGQQDSRAALEAATATPTPSQPGVTPQTTPDKTPLPGAKATVLGRPGVPSTPVRPVPTRNMALGLVAGVILGIAVALTREAVDRTVRDRDELEQLSALPTLGELSGRRGDTPRFGVEDGAFDDAVRSLRTRVLKMIPSDARRVMLTAPFGGEGTTMTAMNLATAFTELGERVLLVEGDPRRSVIAGMMHVKSSLGLANVLIDPELALEAVQPTPAQNLFILASRQPRGSATLPCSTALPDVLEYLAARFDRVVIDAPPVLATADTGLLAGAAEATVLVVRAGRTGVNEVKDALHHLRSTDAEVVGTVLCGARLPQHTKAAVQTYRAKLSGVA